MNLLGLPQTTTVYGAGGVVAAATDLNGVTTTWSYNDALERVAQVRRAARISEIGRRGQRKE